MFALIITTLGVIVAFLAYRYNVNKDHNAALEKIRESLREAAHGSARLWDSGTLDKKLEWEIVKQFNFARESDILLQNQKILEQVENLQDKCTGDYFQSTKFSQSKTTADEIIKIWINIDREIRSLTRK